MIFIVPTPAGDKPEYVAAQRPDYFGESLAETTSKRIPTGVAALDAAIGGGLRSGINIMMAPPGSGKTTLALYMEDKELF